MWVGVRRGRPRPRRGVGCRTRPSIPIFPPPRDNELILLQWPSRITGNTKYSSALTYPNFSTTILNSIRNYRSVRPTSKASPEEQASATIFAFMSARMLAKANPRYAPKLNCQVRPMALLPSIQQLIEDASSRADREDCRYFLTWNVEHLALFDRSQWERPFVACLRQSPQARRIKSGSFSRGRGRPRHTSTR